MFSFSRIECFDYDTIVVPYYSGICVAGIKNYNVRSRNKCKHRPNIQKITSDSGDALRNPFVMRILHSIALESLPATLMEDCNKAVNIMKGIVQRRRRNA
jgi:hypothetical protein